MLKRLAMLAAFAMLAIAFGVAPVGANNSVKVKKSYWYATCKAVTSCDFAAHVGPNGKQLDFLRATGGCRFYATLPLTLPVKVKGAKFAVNQQQNVYSNVAAANTTVTIKISGKFTSSSKIKGSYTVSDTSGECTAAQMATHKFTAKARYKQTGG
jgi:hypothetical protein